MTQDFFQAEKTKRYDLPLSHLDYSYIRECTDVKELEKIIRILRSGDEGCYPEMEKLAIERLEKLNPKSRVLRKDNPVVEMRDLDHLQKQALVEELETWSSEMASPMASKGTVHDESSEGLPPVRSATVIAAQSKVQEQTAGKSNLPQNKKKSLPRSYEEWDRVDIDKELENAEKSQPRQEKPEPLGASTFKPHNVAQQVNTQGLSEEEKTAKAVREKDKGNEAFHAKDYEESILYYSRSLSISPLAATYNNRALAYLRLSRWDETIKDCSIVLQMEPQNIKALLRRGTALKGKGDLQQAGKDLRLVLELEPHNKTAQDLLAEISKLEQKSAKEVKEKGRRMIIEEVEGSDEELTEEIVVEKPDVGKKEPKQSAAVVNGLHEEAARAKPSTSQEIWAEEKDSLDVQPQTKESCPSMVDTALSSFVEKMEQNFIECIETVDGAGDTCTPLGLGKGKEVNADILDRCTCAELNVDNDQVLKPSEHLEVANHQGNNSEGVTVHSSEGVTVHSCDTENEQILISDEKVKQMLISNDKETQVVISDDTKKQVLISEDTKKQVFASDDKEKQVITSDDNEKQVVREKQIIISDDVQKQVVVDTNKQVVSVDETAQVIEVGHLASDSSTEEESGEEAVEVESSPPHARPVYIQRTLSPLQAKLKEKGNALFKSGQYPEAIVAYTQLVNMLQQAGDDQAVNCSLIYNNRAACYLKIGDCQNAIGDCDRALSLLPHSAKALLRRATAYELLEKYRQAYLDYKHVLSIDQRAELAHQGASRCQKCLHSHDGHHWRDKLPPAVKVSYWDIPHVIDEVAAASLPAAPQLPATTTVTIPAAPGSMIQQEPSEIAAPGSMIQQEPSEIAAPGSVIQQEPSEIAAPGSVIQQEPSETAAPEIPEPPSPLSPTPSKSPSAEECFEQIKTDGNLLVQQGNFSEAVKCYCRCLELFSNRPAIYTNRALCYLKLNQAKEALNDCTRALGLVPSNPKAFYRRALARKALKQYKECLQDLVELLKLEPTNTAAKKEMDIVKGLYKREYNELKSHTTAGDKKPAGEPEKRRKRVRIEEVEKDSDTEGKESVQGKPKTVQPKVTGVSPAAKSHKSPQSASLNTHPSSAPSSPEKHAGSFTIPSSPDKVPASRAATEAKKPGRSKAKKGITPQTGQGQSTTVPSAAKVPGRFTPFEFLQHWNSLKQAKDTQPYVQLMEQVLPEDLPKVISNKLDGHMLQIITRCATHDAQTGELERAYRILCNLQQVPRFSTVALFLSNKDKQELKKVLESVATSGSYSAEEVASVRKAYGVK